MFTLQNPACATAAGAKEGSRAGGRVLTACRHRHRDARAWKTRAALQKEDLIGEFQAKVSQNLYTQDGNIRKEDIAQIVNGQNFARIR